MQKHWKLDVFAVFRYVLPSAGGSGGYRNSLRHDGFPCFVILLWHLLKKSLSCIAMTTWSAVIIFHITRLFKYQRTHYHNELVNGAALLSRTRTHIVLPWAMTMFVREHYSECHCQFDVSVCLSVLTKCFFSGSFCSAYLFIYLFIYSFICRQHSNI